MGQGRGESQWVQCPLVDGLLLWVTGAPSRWGRSEELCTAQPGVFHWGGWFREDIYVPISLLTGWLSALPTCLYLSRASPLGSRTNTSRFEVQGIFSKHRNQVGWGAGWGTERTCYGWLGSAGASTHKQAIWLQPLAPEEANHLCWQLRRLQNHEGGKTALLNLPPRVSLPTSLVCLVQGKAPKPLSCLV